MAVKIRLQRFGAKKEAFFRIVVADSSSKRDGRFIEQIGHYNPRAEDNKVVLDGDRAKKWLGEGAIPSETVSSILKQQGVLAPGGAPAAEKNETVSAEQ